MRLLKPFAVAVALALSATSLNAASAAEFCMVTDPTDTPLNVRAAPSNKGKVLDTIENESIVIIAKYSKKQKMGIHQRCRHQTKYWLGVS